MIDIDTKREVVMAEGNEVKPRDGQSQESGMAEAGPMHGELEGHNGLRAHVDELMVQIDLADLDARERVRQQLDTAVNVYLAAKNRVDQARTDAQEGLSELRSALDRVLRDLHRACEAADAVVRRTGQ